MVCIKKKRKKLHLPIILFLKQWMLGKNPKINNFDLEELKFKEMNGKRQLFFVTAFLCFRCKEDEVLLGPSGNLYSCSLIKVNNNGSSIF